MPRSNPVLDGARRWMSVDPYENLLSDRTGERLSKALSMRYLVDKARLVAYERRHPDHPWLTRDALGLLERHLRPEHVGLEWGSGKSTRWFALRCAHLTCVEHHAGWAARVRASLAEAGVKNVDHRLVSEASYVAAAAGIPDGSLDFVLVDGLFRDRALLASIPKLKPGGWLVLDNANWYLPSASKTPHSRSLAAGPAPGFEPAWAQIRSWETVWTSNGVNDTVVFVKPGRG